MQVDRKVYLFILEAGIKLRAQQTTVACAAVLCYRFFKCANTEHHCPYTVAAACLYLAGKAEENFLKIRDVVNVCHRILHASEEELEVDENYWDIREGIGRMEYVLLRTLAFKVHIEHPHTLLAVYLHSLSHWMPGQPDMQANIGSTALAILRDCYACPHVVEGHKPSTVALTALYMAIQVFGVRVPLAEDWWRVFDVSCRQSKLKQVMHEILRDVYLETEPHPHPS